MTTAQPPVMRAYQQALTLLSTDAFVIDRLGIGTMYVEAHTLPAGTVSLAHEFLGGTPPLSSEVMQLTTFDYAVTFPAGFASPQSYGYIDTNPTATFVITLTKISGGVSSGAGTITISPSGVYAFATTGNVAITFNPGDTLKAVAQSTTDATAANFAWTLAAQAA